MNEQLLAFIWENYYFEKDNLQTQNLEKVQIIDFGKSNSEAGADFQNACILIGEMRWFGAVEIHQKTSHWLAHKHQENRNYDNVILHVVYENDLPKNTIQRSDNSPIPLLELKHRINPLIIEKYALLNNSESIPCFSQLEKIPEIMLQNTLDSVLMKRLSRKTKDVQILLQKNQFDWKETFYQRLAEHFGFKKNNDLFLRLSKSVSLKIISKHSDNQLQIESLFFGQAGFLEEIEPNEYAQKLQKEYDFLAHKYQISESKLKRSNWKFLRMRPANFPTVRLAQFMALVSTQKLTFTKIIQLDSVKEIRALFDVKLSEYWQKNYDFDKPISKPTTLGKSSIDNLIINVICPLLVCYGQEKDQMEFIQKALQFLRELPPENNKITRLWKSKLQNKNAYESQAILELYNNFCAEKACLNCQTGKYLLHQNLESNS